MQGILEIYHKVEGFLKEISGLDRFNFQAGGGARAYLPMPVSSEPIMNRGEIFSGMRSLHHFFSPLRCGQSGHGWLQGHYPDAR
jgi:hypothetical protein